MITALIIFIITYLFIGLRQIPRLHIDRPAGALVGAVLMVVFGVLTLDQAFSAIDMNTLLCDGRIVSHTRIPCGNNQHRDSINQRAAKQHLPPNAACHWGYGAFTLPATARWCTDKS